MKMTRAAMTILVALVTIMLGGCLGSTGLTDDDRDFLGDTIAQAKEEAVSEAVTEAATYTNASLDAVSEQVASSLQEIATATATAHARAESAEVTAKSYTDTKIEEVRKEIAEISSDTTRSRYSPDDTIDEEEKVTRFQYSPDEPDAKVFVGQSGVAGGVFHRETVSVKGAKNPVVSINQADAKIVNMDGLLGLDGEKVNSIHVGESGEAFTIRHTAKFDLRGTDKPVISYNQKGAKISRSLALAQAWHNAKHKFLGESGKAFVLENKQKADVTGAENPIVSIRDLEVGLDSGDE